MTSPSAMRVPLCQFTACSNSFLCCSYAYTQLLVEQQREVHLPEKAVTSSDFLLTLLFLLRRALHCKQEHSSYF